MNDWRKNKKQKKANLLGLSKKPLQVQMQYPQPCALFCIILGCSNSIFCYKKERERERERERGKSEGCSGQRASLHLYGPITIRLLLLL
jgi:hypothetical protein